MARTQPFKMRLTDKEVTDLETRASRDGIAKADVIRKAMGWEVVGLVKPSSEPGNGATATSPPPASPSAGEPGVAAAGELARRIADRRKQ